MTFIVSNHKPRKGTETRCRPYRHLPLRLVSNHKPRKGTETAWPAEEDESVRGVSNHKPRKGTETLPPFPLSALATSRFKSQTPQGDGNPPLLVVDIAELVLFQITNPARGRKRDKQGRESYYHLRQFQITNPARGRKQVAAEMECRVLTLVSNHKPRKGTETSAFLDDLALAIRFKSQTPQGDGNATSA